MSIIQTLLTGISFVRHKNVYKFIDSWTTIDNLALACAVIEPILRIRAHLRNTQAFVKGCHRVKERVVFDMTKSAAILANGIFHSLSRNTNPD